MKNKTIDPKTVGMPKSGKPWKKSSKKYFYLVINLAEQVQNEES
jgi:hypothetical protein